MQNYEGRIVFFEADVRGHVIGSHHQVGEMRGLSPSLGIKFQGYSLLQAEPYPLKPKDY